MNVYIIMEYGTDSNFVEPDVTGIIDVFKDEVEAEAECLALNKSNGINWSDSYDDGYDDDIEDVLYYEVIVREVK